MSFAKSIARKIIFPSTLMFGVDKILQSRSSNNCLVLMFHGVTENDTTWFSPRHLKTSQFEKVIVYLKKNFEIVDVPTAFKIKAGQYKPSRKAVCLTFDDGYENNLTQALPVLEKHQVKATFFVSSMCTLENEQSILWADLITGAFLKLKNQKLTFDNREYSNYIDTENGNHIFDYIKKMNSELRDSALSEFVKKYDVIQIMNQIDPTIWRLMNREELKKFASSPVVSIGSHGHLHYNLGDIEVQGANDDLNKSISILSELTSHNITSIAYPDGSYNSGIKKIAEEKGLIHQFAVKYKGTEDKQDLRILNRHGVSSTTTYEANIMHLSTSFSKEGF